MSNSWKNKLDELFQGEDSIEVSCPRCGAKYTVTRDMIEDKSEFVFHHHQ